MEMISTEQIVCGASFNHNLNDCYFLRIYVMLMA